MSTTLPDKTNGTTGIIDTPTVGQQKTNLGNLRDFIADLFGTSTASLSTVWSAFKLMTPDLLANVSTTFAVGSNALTIALKTRAGATASATDPVLVGMRSATAGNGDFNLRGVTGALSLVVSSGSTLGLANSDSTWCYVYLIDNAGTLELAISQRWFGHSGIVSTTAEGGAGAADSASVMYSTTARSNVPFRAIQRIKIPQTTAGTYTAVPTSAELQPFTPMLGPDGAGLVLIETKLASASAQLDFVTGLTSEFNRYTLTLTDIVPATNAVDLWLRVSEDAGATFKSGASDYGHQRRSQTDGAAATATGSTGDTKIVLTSGISSAANKTLNGTIEFWNPAGTSRNKQFQARTLSNGATWATYNVDADGIYIGTTNAINGVRLLMSSGNIASGTVSLYGSRK